MIVREDLKAFVDGELTQEQMAEWEKAIAEDSQLAEDVRFFQLLSGEVKVMATEPVAQGAEATLAALRKPDSLQLRFARHGWAIAGLGAFSLLALAVMFPVFAQSKESAKRTMAMAQARMAERSKSATVESAASAGSSTYQAPMADTPSIGGSVTMKDKTAASFPARAEYAKKLPMESRFGAGGAGASPMTEAETYRGRPSNGTERADDRDLLNRLNGKTVTSTSEAHQYMRPMMRRNADLSVGVKSAMTAQDDLQKTVIAWQGFVMTSNLQSNDGETRVLMTIKVPEMKFEETLRYIRKLGKVISENSQGEDVTAEVVDARTRVEVLADEEANLVKLLEKTKDFGRQMNIRSQIRQVRAELASYKAQKKALEEQTSYSQLTITLIEKEGGSLGDSWSEDSWSQATGGLEVVGKAFGRMAIFVLVYIPVWAPLAVIAYLLFRRR